MVGRLIGILGSPFTGWGPTVINDTVTETATIVDLVSATVIVIGDISEVMTAYDIISASVTQGWGIELGINF
jgi:hypothetical protein